MKHSLDSFYIHVEENPRNYIPQNFPKIGKFNSYTKIGHHKFK